MNDVISSMSAIWLMQMLSALGEGLGPMELLKYYGTAGKSGSSSRKQIYRGGSDS
jgi:hypothetical protein